MICKQQWPICRRGGHRRGRRVENLKKAVALKAIDTYSTNLRGSRLRFGISLCSPSRRYL